MFCLKMRKDAFFVYIGETAHIAAKRPKLNIHVLFFLQLLKLEKKFSDLFYHLEGGSMGQIMRICLRDHVSFLRKTSYLQLDTCWEKEVKNPGFQLEKTKKIRSSFNDSKNKLYQ